MLLTITAADISATGAVVLVVLAIVVGLVLLIAITSLRDVRVARWEAERAADDRAYADRALGTAPAGKADGP